MKLQPSDSYSVHFNVPEKACFHSENGWFPPGKAVASNNLGPLRAHEAFFTITVNGLFPTFKILDRTLADLIIKPYLCLVVMSLKNCCL